MAYDGSVLVRSAFAPSPGTRVVDKRQRPLGRVMKVFGPVKEPFAAVRPDGKVPLSLLGSDVYVSEGNDAVQEGRRGRRSH
ncbi:MAG: Gar1/Naf1 family protein [Candidatus Thermoplasmatota archaeon]